MSEDAFFSAVRERAREHARMLASWRTDMGKSPLALKLPVCGVSRIEEAAAQALHSTEGEDEEHAKEFSDDEEADDKSSIYTEDEEDEDEPGAEQWDQSTLR